MTAARLLAAATMAVGSLIGAQAVAQTTASADGSQCSPFVEGKYGNCAGLVWFQSLGEHLYVDDRIADGYSAVALYWLEGEDVAVDPPHEVWNSGGADGGDVDENLDLAEGTRIIYKACLGDNGSVLMDSCSGGFVDAG